MRIYEIYNITEMSRIGIDADKIMPYEKHRVDPHTLAVDYDHMFEFRVNGMDLHVYHYADGGEIKIGYIEKSTNNQQSIIFVGSISLVEIPDMLGYANIYQITFISISDDMKGNGIGTEILKELVDAGFVLLGDYLEYIGMRLIWSKLSKLPGYQVDIVDVENKKIIETAVNLHHGKGEYDFDKRLWSTTAEKENFRALFYKKG